MKKFTHNNLVILYGYRCNYKCDGCSTSSNVVHNEDPDFEKTLASIPILADLYDVDSMVSLIGGEPFLYWDERIVPLALEINKYFPGVRINIFTNGQLFGRNIGKFLELADQVENVAIEVTNHLSHLPDTVAGKKWHESIQQAKNHPRIKVLRSNHWHVEGNINANIYTFEQQLGWVQSVNVLPDGKIKPWMTGDPAKSLNTSCCGPVCAAANNGKLYKCLSLSVVKSRLTVANQLDDPDWETYLNSPTVDLFNLTDRDLAEFEENYGKPISQCDMCPVHDGIINWTDRTYDSIIKS